VESPIRRFFASADACGENVRELAVGDCAFRFEGLADDHAAALERQWGPFLTPDSGLSVDRTIRVCDGHRGVWLAEPQPGELYRVEARTTPSGVIALSYAFALGPCPDGSWRLALDTDSGEPAARTLENAARVLTARMAAERGGFALHSAGVLRDGKAWIFTGPSGAGKSTAVRLSAPAVSLGDDFGLVLPGPEGWVTPPLPFDNAEAIVERPEGTNYLIAGIWRLFQAQRPRVERPTGLEAVTSLSSCLALPWVMPDLTGALLEQIDRFCEESHFGHLHFGLDGGFWGPLRAAVKRLD
jgi:hypothetical protein